MSDKHHSSQEISRDSSHKPNFAKTILAHKFFFGMVILLFVIISVLPSESYYQKLQLPTSNVPERSIDFNIKQLPVPVLVTSDRPGYLSAKSVLVFDPDSQIVLFEKDSRERLLPASTAKLMTALVAIDNCDLNKTVTVNHFETTGSQMGLQLGERITVRSLLYGMLISSGNDAASVLAQYCADGEGGFVELMNEKAAEIGLSQTHFVNPTGLDAKGLYSTAADLGRLASFAIENKTIAQIVSVKETSVPDATFSIWHSLSNVNQLLGKVPGIFGIKTGETAGAKENLIALAAKDNHRVVTVILGSDDRFGETQQIIEWTFKNVRWQKVD